MNDREIIADALRLIGAYGATEPLDPNDLALGRRTLSRMLGDWRNQALTVHTYLRTVKPLSASTQTYTIGTGGSINIRRPRMIPAWSVITNRNDTNPIELPRKKVLTFEGWQRIAIKSLTSELPTELYFDRDWNAGLGSVSIWPIPTVDYVDLVLYTPEDISDMDPNVDYSFPDGYEAAILSNLAIKLKPFFDEAIVPEDVRREAISTLGHIKSVNWIPPDIADDGIIGTRGHYNIYTDDHQRH